MPDLPCWCRAVQGLEMIYVGSSQGDPDAMSLFELIGRGKQFDQQWHYFTWNKGGGISAAKGVNGKRTC